MIEYTEAQVNAFAAVTDGVICWLYNSSKDHFIKVFGPEADQGLYLWDKFTNHFNANEGTFFNYLDRGNRQKLMKAVLVDIQKGRF